MFVLDMLIKLIRRHRIDHRNGTIAVAGEGSQQRTGTVGIGDDSGITQRQRIANP